MNRTAAIQGNMLWVILGAILSVALLYLLFQIFVGDGVGNWALVLEPAKALAQPVPIFDFPCIFNC